MLAAKRTRLKYSNSGALILVGSEPYPTKICTNWRLRKYVDVIVVVEGRCFDAHRFVLEAGSDYFDGLFHAGMADSSRSTIHLPDMPAAAFEIVITFLYYGEAELVDSTVALEVLRAASWLQVTALQRLLVETLTLRLGPKNCLAVWHAADELCLSDLVESARKTTLHYFGAIAMDDIFKLPLMWMCSLYEDDELNVTEEVAFEIAVSWCKAQQPPATATTALLLFKAIRYTCMESAFVEERVAMESLLDCHEEYTLMFRAFAQLDGVVKSRSRVSYTYVYGGVVNIHKNSHYSLRCMEVFDPLLGIWEAGPPMATGRAGACAVVFKGNVYVFGGQDGNSNVLSCVEVFNPLRGTWEAGAHMTTGRVHACAAMTDGKIYAIGGSTGKRGENVFSSVEVFDPSVGKWEAGPPMAKERAGACASVVEGKVYVCGGYGGNVNVNVNAYDSLCCMEVLDPLSGV